MTDGIAWLMLTAAALAVVGVFLFPRGRSSARAQLGFAGFMVLAAISRMADPVDPLRSVLLILQLIAGIAAIGFLLLSFRPGELPRTRKHP